MLLCGDILIESSFGILGTFALKILFKIRCKSAAAAAAAAAAWWGRRCCSFRAISCCAGDFAVLVIFSRWSFCCAGGFVALVVLVALVILLRW